MELTCKCKIAPGENPTQVTNVFIDIYAVITDSNVIFPFFMISDVHVGTSFQNVYALKTSHRCRRCQFTYKLTSKVTQFDEIDIW